MTSQNCADFFRRISRRHELYPLGLLQMGIVNVTPDSFSDGGLYADTPSALVHARQLIAAGAAMIDVGGQSTRPGFERVSPDEELRRVIPVIRSLAAETTIPISIDTDCASVAHAALEAGAVMINDVSGGLTDPAILPLAAASGAAVCIGHIFPQGGSYHDSYPCDDPITEVMSNLAARRNAFLDAGCAPEQLYLDPGIGFGKTTEQNLAILAQLPALLALGSPLVVGVSRKRFLGGTTLEEKDRLTAEWTPRLAAAGVAIVRVHRIAELPR